MADLPIILRVAGKRCVVIGGGPVAKRRAAALLEAGADVVLIAPDVDPELARMRVKLYRRQYHFTDLVDAFMVIVATNNPLVNKQVAVDARQAHPQPLLNRADEPGAGDFIVPAHAHHGPVTIAVHTSGVSAGAAAAIRRELSNALNPNWPLLLVLAAPYRKRIQQAFNDTTERTQRLSLLAGDHAHFLLEARGEAPLVEFYEELADPERPLPDLEGDPGASDVGG
jgi:siroheme synthase-like protein